MKYEDDNHLFLINKSKTTLKFKKTLLTPRCILISCHDANVILLIWQFALSSFRYQIKKNHNKYGMFIMHCNLTLSSFNTINKSLEFIVRIYVIPCRILKRRRKKKSRKNRENFVRFLCIICIVGFFSP